MERLAKRAIESVAYRQVRGSLDLKRSTGPLGTGLVVEIGCGLGRLTRPLAGYFKCVVGADIAEEMLKIAPRDVAAPNITANPHRRLAQVSRP